MTCIKTQSLITAFINDELEIDVLEAFVEHIRTCDECSEELEVYYALLTAMKQLDEDKNLSNNYKQELIEKLDKTEERIIHLRYNYYRKKGVLVFIMLLWAMFFSLQHYFDPPPLENPVAESRFGLRKSFMEDRFDKTSEELEGFLENQE